MADIKLFRTNAGHVQELSSGSAALEKRLQHRIERDLDVFLGVRFLETEYSTGRKHRGRIDTLGLDENNSPVIIEYKRSTGENVINQGLFYLDWLLDHRAEFEAIVTRKLGDAEVDWSSPRLLCIASDFTRYDEHAVEQINRSIELIRYRQYGEELLLFELVNAPPEERSSSSYHGSSSGSTANRDTISDKLAKAPTHLIDWYETLEEYTLSLGDDVTKKELKHYFAYRRLRNFACVEVHPGGGHILVYVKVNPDDVDLSRGPLRDVRKIGHYGTGDLEVRVTEETHLDLAREMINKSYEVS